VGAHVSVPMYRRTLPQRLRLEGRRCVSCGRVQFPPAAACPGCFGDRFEPYILSGRGVVEAATYITAAGAPPEFTAQARAEGGYWVAIVRLAEGPKITAQLTGFETPPQIGQPVEAVVRRLYVEEGVIRYGFKFQPAKEGSA
jgi:uncharacterized OB-fold protein